jgi:hypothetical protein
MTTENDGAAETHRPNRRTLLRDAVAAGLVAWSAPAIVDSLASPAAAFTAPIGCWTVLFNSECNANNQGTPCNQTAIPMGCTVNAALATCVATSGDCQNGPLTISIAGGCQGQCKIIHADASAGTECVAPSPDPTPGSPATSVTFPIRTSPGYNQFAIVLQCT